MKLRDALGGAVMGSATAISAYSFAANLLPPPYNAVLFGGATLVAAAASAQEITRGKSLPVGDSAALPGIPSRRVKEVADKPKSEERTRLIAKYDRAFAAMLARQESGSKSQMLERLRPILYDLSPEIKAWTGDLRLRVYLLMREIAKDIEDPACTGAGLSVLLLLLSRGGRPAVELARPMVREKIAAMYRNSASDTARFIPRLLLILDDYDPASVERLTRDAIHVWGDEQFRSAVSYLGFEELKTRGLRSTIKGLLGEEIAKAGNAIDRTALNRAIELYHEVA